MAVTIIVEDGTNVANANSYQSVDDLTAFADQRGITVTGDADAKGRLLLQAMDYLSQYGNQWLGVPTYAYVGLAQALPFPRTGIWHDYAEIAGNTIPGNLKLAQLHLAGFAASGVVLVPNVEAGLPVIREKVGPIDTTYASPVDLGGASWRYPEFPVVDALLEPLLNRGFYLTTVRI